jgi:hypothetical protein
MKKRDRWGDEIQRFARRNETNSATQHCRDRATSAGARLVLGAGDSDFLEDPAYANGTAVPIPHWILWRQASAIGYVRVPLVRGLERQAAT